MPNLKFIFETEQDSCLVEYGVFLTTDGILGVSYQTFSSSDDHFLDDFCPSGGRNFEVRCIKGEASFNDEEGRSHILRQGNASIWFESGDELVRPFLAADSTLRIEFLDEVADAYPVMPPHPLARLQLLAEIQSKIKEE